MKTYNFEITAGKAAILEIPYEGIIGSLNFSVKNKINGDLLTIGTISYNTNKVTISLSVTETNNSIFPANYVLTSTNNDIVNRLAQGYINVIQPVAATAQIIPSGGLINDVLTKASGSDYDVNWTNPTATTSTPGFVQLGGDISGSYNNLQVKKLDSIGAFLSNNEISQSLLASVGYTSLPYDLYSDLLGGPGGFRLFGLYIISDQPVSWQVFASSAVDGVSNATLIDSGSATVLSKEWPIINKRYAFVTIDAGTTPPTSLNVYTTRRGTIFA